MQVAALIGDVVGSRRTADRAGLQERLLDTLARISGRHGSELRVTLGDEFQGTFQTVAEAVHGAWNLHLSTIGWATLRIGIGWGEIVVEGDPETPYGQDGPAWWRARDAIEAVDSSHPSRTLIITESDWDPLLNAYLTLRDANLDHLDETDAVILSVLAEGGTQRSAAERLGLHESSVSRRVSRKDLASLVQTTAVPIPRLHV